MNFDQFIRDIEENQWNVFGVEVYEDGRLIHSYGDTVENRHPIYSATKTITSIAVGMAADEGKLDIKKGVLRYLPEEVVGKMLSEQRKAYESITVERLLTMSVAGYPFRPGGATWLEEALNYPLPEAEKREFNYSNVSAYLAGVAASCALGEDLYQYLKRKLFDPLEIASPPCGRCPEGYFYGATGMELTVHELSKIGQLLCDGGYYKGKQLVSEAYVKAATAVQQMNREGGYGYFIWKYGEGFSINGKWGQKCYVLPQKRQVITFLSHMENAAPLKESARRLLSD